MAAKREQPSTSPIPVFRENSGAPFIYFDMAPAHGIFNGAIQIELASRVLTPTPDDGGIDITFRETGHLRCSPTAAVSLRDALNKSLEMLEQASADAQRVAAGKLN